LLQKYVFLAKEAFKNRINSVAKERKCFKIWDVFLKKWLGGLTLALFCCTLAV